MTRYEKVKALEAVAAGRANLASLQPPQQYCFDEISDRQGIYLMEGKEYSVDQYFAFCEDNERHTIICITKHQPSLIKSNLTLNLN
jgi:hypothetical protein